MSNLLTKEEKKSVRKEYFLRTAVVSLALLFFTAALGATELLPSFFFSSVAKKLKNDELQRLSTEGAVGEEMSKAIKRMNTVTTFLSGEKNDSALATEVIRKVLSSRVQGVIISGFTFEKNKDSQVLAVIGVAEARADLIAFVANLRNSEEFISVDVPAENLAKAENIVFNVRISGDF